MNSSLHGYLIDPFKRQVSQVQLKRDRSCVPSILGDHVQSISSDFFHNCHDELITDTDARYVAIQEGFSILRGGLYATQNHQAFLGKALVMGSSGNGNNVPPTLSLQDLSELIHWGVV